jgi:O-acetyl-ADP-ribose deacetylase (regulator of RNase III)
MTDNQVIKLGNTGLYAMLGDITQIPSPAIMTAINSGGAWFGGVDGAIMRVAGMQYHSQAAAAMPLSDLDVVVAKGDRKMHKGQFNDVIFVVDDLESSLDKVVYKGLEAAHNQGYVEILIPAIRMGVMAGSVEKSPRETMGRIRYGIDSFIQDYGAETALASIIFVVYNDSSTLRQLADGLRSAD